MGITTLSPELVHYRLLIVEPLSQKLLALSCRDRYCLPQIGIPVWARPAREVQDICRSLWDLQVFVVRFLALEQDVPVHYAIVEVLARGSNALLKLLPPEQALDQESPEARCVLLGKLFTEDGCQPMDRVGWIDAAIQWVESSVGREISVSAQVEQFNAGGGFALVRFTMEEGSHYWLKATGGPNAHEFGINCYLSDPNRATSQYLPQLIDTREPWNAWLMAGDAMELSEMSRDPLEALPVLNDVVVSLARLQIATVGEVDSLLALGSSDHRFGKLFLAVPELFDYLQIAMSCQASTRVPRVERSRLAELRKVVGDTCRRMEDLELPVSLVHGDLNRGNILRKEHCFFIDWSEARVGCPLLSLQHALLLNQVDDGIGRGELKRSLMQSYGDEWGVVSDLDRLEDGLRSTPLLAALSALYGRGDWLRNGERDHPNRLAYARTLTRHMDRAAREMNGECEPCS